MSRKRIWSLVLIGALLAACGPATAPGSTPEANTSGKTQNTSNSNSETTILRFAVSGFEQGRYDNLIDAFEAENPGVHISVVSIESTLGTDRPGASWPDDAYLRLAAAADVIGAVATRAAVQQGAVLDLTQFFEGDSTLTPDAFYPILLDSVKWDGRIWSVPSQANYQLIYYDKKMFDAAGLAYPQPGWTWSDFLADAKALTVGSGDQTTQWGFVQPDFDPIMFVQAYGGLLFDLSVSPPKAKLNTAAVVDAVKWYTDLFLTYHVAPYSTGADQTQPGAPRENDPMRLITDGKAAMWTGMGGFRGGPGERADQQQTGVVPFPVKDAGDHSTPATVSGYSISAGTNKAALAWKWISYLVQQQGGQRGQFSVTVSGGGPGQQGGQRQFSIMGGNSVSAMPSVAAAGGFWDNLDEQSSAALKYAIDHAYVDTYDGAGMDTFSQAVADVIENGTAIETALNTAQTQVEADIEAEVAAAPTPVANLTVAEDEEKAVNAGAAIIEFGMSEGRFGQQSYANLVTQFEQAHPDIVVELKTPEGFRGGMSLAEMAAEYDCFQASPSFTDESLAAILNLEPFLAADSTVRKDDFYPAVLDQFTYQGQVWGLPGSVQTINVISYNKDLFDAAGLAYPSPTWTTSDFLEAAVALTKGEGDTKQYGFAPNTFGAGDLIAFLDRLGVKPIDSSVDPVRLVFNSSEVEQVFRWYTGLTTQYKVVPTFDEAADSGPRSGFQQRQTLINTGRVAMWMDTGGGRGFSVGPGTFVQIGPGTGEASDSQINVGVVPLPSGLNSAQGSSFQSSTGYFISANTQARQACYNWISFLTGQVDAASGLPARKSVAESAAYREQVGAERADAYITSVTGGNQASFYQQVADEENWLGFATMWLSAAYDRVIGGEMTVEESLAKAQESFDAYRNCMIAKNAFNDREAQMACVTEAGGLGETMQMP